MAMTKKQEESLLRDTAAFQKKRVDQAEATLDKFAALEKFSLEQSVQLRARDEAIVQLALRLAAYGDPKAV